MSDRNLTVARLAEEFIGGVEIEGGAFGQFLSTLGVAPKVERTAIVTSKKPGEETRAYVVQVHTVPGTGGTTRVYACTCPAFKYHELPYPEQIEDDVEAGFESIGRCKHGEAVAVADRTAEDRESGQEGFEAFAASGGER